MKLPSKPTGNTDRVAWDAQMREFVQSLQLIAGPGVRIKVTPRGTIIEISAADGGTSSARDNVWL